MIKLLKSSGCWEMDEEIEKRWDQIQNMRKKILAAVVVHQKTKIGGGRQGKEDHRNLRTDSDEEEMEDLRPVDTDDGRRLRSGSKIGEQKSRKRLRAVESDKDMVTGNDESDKDANESSPGRSGGSADVSPRGSKTSSGADGKNFGDAPSSSKAALGRPVMKGVASGKKASPPSSTEDEDAARAMNYMSESGKDCDDESDDEWASLRKVCGLAKKKKKLSDD